MQNGIKTINWLVLVGWLVCCNSSLVTSFEVSYKYVVVRAYNLVPEKIFCLDSLRRSKSRRQRNNIDFFINLRKRFSKSSRKSYLVAKTGACCLVTLVLAVFLAQDLSRFCCYQGISSTMERYFID